MPRRRLDFDSMLAASDELDITMGGKPIDLNASPAIPRRSVYGFVNRDIIANLMSTFDPANPNACTAQRPETTVPQQALFALNSDFIQDRAARLASITKQLSSASDEDRIVAMVRRTLCRTPTESEVNQAKTFLSEAIPSATSDRRCCSGSGTKLDTSGTRTDGLERVYFSGLTALVRCSHSHTHGPRQKKPN